MTAPETARAFAPASVSNVGCGFDALGFALAGPGDEVSATRTESPGLTIGRIEGDGGKLPLDPERNTASVAAAALLAAKAPGAGVRLDIRKCMPSSSGLGSSAASAVAAVVAVDALLGAGLSREQLLQFALAGETLASGSAHADNLAPSLYGGMVLVRSLDPVPDIVPLPVPPDLACAVIRPHIEVSTKAAREILSPQVALHDAVTQWANLGAFVAALFRGDLELLSRSLHDVIAEPLRAPLVPGFAAVKKAALEAGALGCSLSGSGPAVFALCRELSQAETVAAAMRDGLAAASGLDGDLFVSPVRAPGAIVLDAKVAEEAR